MYLVEFRKSKSAPEGCENFGDQNRAARKNTGNDEHQQQLSPKLMIDPSSVELRI